MDVSEGISFKENETENTRQNVSNIIWLVNRA